MTGGRGKQSKRGGRTARVINAICCVGWNKTQRRKIRRKGKEGGDGQGQPEHPVAPG